MWCAGGCRLGTVRGMLGFELGERALFFFWGGTTSSVDSSVSLESQKGLSGEKRQRLGELGASEVGSIVVESKVKTRMCC